MSKQAAATDHVLLLKRRPFRDRGDLVDGLSRTSGRVAGVVHRSKSFFPDPPALIQVSRRPGSGLDTFSQPLLQSGYSGMRSNLEALLAAGFLGRLFLGCLPEREPNEGAFLLLCELFGALNEGAGPRVCGLWGQCRLLGLLGVEPHLNGCVNCGVAEVAAFSASEGGFLCSTCFSGDGFRVDAKELPLLRRLGRDPLEDFSEGELLGGEVRLAGRVFKSQFQTHLDLSPGYFKRVLPRKDGQK